MIGCPLISRYASGRTLGLLSMTFPEPLNDLPSISSDTPILRTSPVNSQRVLRLSISDVPSKTWTTARLPATSRTWPERLVPSPRLRLTISAYFGSFTLSRMTRGPLTPAIVLFIQIVGQQGVVITNRNETARGELNLIHKI